MSVDVINISRHHSGHRAGLPHRGQRRITLRMRLCEMMQIDGCAVAGKFAEDDRAALARRLQRFERHQGGAFADRQSIAVRVEGPAKRW